MAITGKGVNAPVVVKGSMETVTERAGKGVKAVTDSTASFVKDGGVSAVTQKGKERMMNLSFAEAITLGICLIALCVSMVRIYGVTAGEKQFETMKLQYSTELSQVQGQVDELKAKQNMVTDEVGEIVTYSPRDAGQALASAQTALSVTKESATDSSYLEQAGMYLTDSRMAYCWAPRNPDYKGIANIKWTCQANYLTTSEGVRVVWRCTNGDANLAVATGIYQEGIQKFSDVQVYYFDNGYVTELLDSARLEITPALTEGGAPVLPGPNDSDDPNAVIGDGEDDDGDGDEDPAASEEPAVTEPPATTSPTAKPERPAVTKPPVTTTPKPEKPATTPKPETPAVTPKPAETQPPAQTSFTVSFDSQGGSVSTSSKKVTKGQQYGTLPKPSREGHSFDGWYTSASGGTLVTAGSTFNGTANQTLYAHWTAAKYTITFNPNGGSVNPMSKTVSYGSAVGSLPTPVRDGYIFQGWYTSASGGNKEDGMSTVTAHRTLYAHWTADDSAPPPGTIGDGPISGQPGSGGFMGD